MSIIRLGEKNIEKCQLIPGKPPENPEIPGKHNGSPLALLQMQMGLAQLTGIISEIQKKSEMLRRNKVEHCSLVGPATDPRKTPGKYKPPRKTFETLGRTAIQS